jgi:hypothetical protein
MFDGVKAFENCQIFALARALKVGSKLVTTWIILCGGAV